MPPRTSCSRREIIQTGNERLLLRVSGAFEAVRDILAVNFVANGRLIRLRDIATVRRGYADPPQPMFRVNGQSAIGIAISMREGGDILTLGRNVEQAMHGIRANLPIGIEPVLVADQPAVVDHAISDFTTSLWQAIAIIMAVSFVSLGVRAGAVIALSIPLTLAIVFPVMEFTGIDLQRISLGALIIALGLLVDDAMTTVDVMTSRLAAGDSKEDAATFAYKTLALPMLTGSFVTAAGFIPIGFARSSAGEYTFSIFAVVSYALILSWIVAVLFAPLLGVVILAKPKAKPSDKPSAILVYFRRLLIGAMRMRWITIGLTLACFVAAIMVSPFIPRQFFPPSDRPDLLVDLTLPQNASIFASESAAERLDGLLKRDPDVGHWSTYVGRGAIRFYLPLNVELANDFFSQAVVVAKDVAARKRLQERLEKELPDAFPSAVTRVSPLGLGPPVGWPVQYRVSGPDISEVRNIALQLAQVVSTAPGAKDVNFDWMEPARMVRIQIDQDQARLLGLSSAAIASVMNTVVTGTPVTQVRDGIFLVDVLTRATDEQRLSLATLRNLQIPLPNGRTVPLSQIATFDFGQEFPLIWQRDRVPTLTVRADVHPGVLPETVVQALAPAVDKLNASLPPPFRIATGGTVEESQISQASVFAVVPLMLFAMVTFLMIQLQSFSQTFSGLERRADGFDRHCRGASAVPEAAGICCNSRHPFAAWHDRAQCGHPDRADRLRACARSGNLECGHRGELVPVPPDYADRNLNGPRTDPDRNNNLLGPDGLCRHGRVVGRDGSDPDLFAGTLRYLVPRQGADGDERCGAGEPDGDGRSVSAASGEIR